MTELSPEEQFVGSVKYCAPQVSIIPLPDGRLALLSAYGSERSLRQLFSCPEELCEFLASEFHRNREASKDTRRRTQLAPAVDPLAGLSLKDLKI